MDPILITAIVELLLKVPPLIQELRPKKGAEENAVDSRVDAVRDLVRHLYAAAEKQEQERRAHLSALEAAQAELVSRIAAMEERLAAANVAIEASRRLSRFLAFVVAALAGGVCLILAVVVAG